MKFNRCVIDLESIHNISAICDDLKTPYSNYHDVMDPCEAYFKKADICLWSDSDTACIDDIAELLPKYEHNILIGCPVHFLANEHTLFLSSYQDQCNRFILNGGESFVIADEQNKMKGYERLIRESLTKYLENPRLFSRT